MVYIDTNILLDIVFKRKNCDIAEVLFRTLFQKEEEACISASAVTDLFYIIRKETHDLRRTYELMGNIFKLVFVLPVTTDDVKAAFQRRWKDFEDCVQYKVAEHNGVKYIVTSNVKDYEETAVKVMKPEDYLEM
ncbi:MAG: PIN domain-containing protein [Eubacteriales bacterium]|nr:PIN domain-containing protein [Eubacteriales bacterium]